MKQLYSNPIANQSTLFNIPRGQYGALAVEFSGVANTGQTLALADCGAVKLSFNNEEVINVDFEFLALANNLYGGVTKFSSVTAGAFYIFAVIPLSAWFDSANILDVSETDNAYLRLDYSTASTKALSGNVRVYGKVKYGVMNYLHKIINRNVNVSGATTFSDSLLIPNISQVYLKNPSASNVTDIQIIKDNDVIVDASTDLVQAYSDYIHQVETSQTLVAVEMGETKDIREVLGNSIQYKYVFSGAGILNQYISYYVFTKDKAIESQSKTLQKIKSNIS